MAKIMVGRGGTIIGSWFIDDKRLTIGRAEGVDVKLDNQAVSKQHAAIEVMGADHIVLDLGSSNGTFVNGTKITRHLLRHGDTIEILNFQLRYVDHKSVVQSEGDRTAIFRGDEAETLRAIATQTPPGPGKTPATEARAVEILLPTAVLKGTAGRHAGVALDLQRTLTPLGDRGKDYAAIFRRPSGFVIARVRGRPPRIDGKPVADGWQPLREGAVIEVGGDRFELHIARAEPTS